MAMAAGAASPFSRVHVGDVLAEPGVSFTAALQRESSPRHDGAPLVVELEQRANGHVHLRARADPLSRPQLARAHSPHACALLPLGNAATCPALDARTRALRMRRPDVSLAACVVVYDGGGCVLLTRRARHMRSFPGCWVFPGGGVDPGESVRAAALRELREETGIELPGGEGALQPLCLWESCFPTRVAACVEAGELKGHHLVVFFAARASRAAATALSLQREETDAAVWLPSDAALERGGARDAVDADGAADRDERLELPRADAADVAVRGARAPSVALAELRGVYTTARGRGTGEGHIFARRVLHKMIK